MQILKEEIKNRIIKVAKGNFLEHGYQKASMRTIAKDTGISVSNLYIYYKNKEDLFNSIVSDAYYFFHEIQKSIKEHKRDKDESKQFMDMLIKTISGMIKNYRTSFLLIMNKSEGTKYYEHKKNMQKFLADHFLDELSVKEKEDADRLVMNIAAKNLINGMIDIARNYKSDSGVDKNISKLMNYHFSGIFFLKRK